MTRELSPSIIHEPPHKWIPVRHFHRTGGGKTLLRKPLGLAWVLEGLWVSFHYYPSASSRPGFFSLPLSLEQKLIPSRLATVVFAKNYAHMHTSEHAHILSLQSMHTLHTQSSSFFLPPSSLPSFSFFLSSCLSFLSFSSPFSLIINHLGKSNLREKGCILAHSARM